MKEVRASFIEVNLMAIFSILLVLIWYAYNQHVNPYVMASIKRFHKIELELYKIGFDVELHFSIAGIRQRRGIHVTFCLFLVIFGAWVLRILLLGMHVVVLGYLVVMILVLVAHVGTLNATNWGNEIKKIRQERISLMEKRRKIKT